MDSDASGAVSAQTSTTQRVDAIYRKPTAFLNDAASMSRQLARLMKMIKQAEAETVRRIDHQCREELIIPTAAWLRALAAARADVDHLAARSGAKESSPDAVRLAGVQLVQAVRDLTLEDQKKTATTCAAMTLAGTGKATAREKEIARMRADIDAVREALGTERDQLLVASDQLAKARGASLYRQAKANKELRSEIDAIAAATSAARAREELLHEKHAARLAHHRKRMDEEMGRHVRAANTFGARSGSALARSSHADGSDASDPGERRRIREMLEMACTELVERQEATQVLVETVRMRVAARKLADCDGLVERLGRRARATASVHAAVRSSLDQRADRVKALCDEVARLQGRVDADGQASCALEALGI